MSNHDLHHDWLALIEISGPFPRRSRTQGSLSQGLEELDGTKRKRLRQAYEEWREALETDDPQFAECTLPGSTRCCRVGWNSMRTAKATF
jgi:hypothetical protein